MKRLTPALLLLLTACNADNLDVATTGDPVVAVHETPALWVHSFPTTTTTPRVEAVVPAQARTTGDCAGWRDLIARHFPAEVVENACAVMLCESHGDPNAVSDTNDHGLFQLNVVHAGSFDWSHRYDPEVNVAFAAWLWSSEGWRPWACRGAAA